MAAGVRIRKELLDELLAGHDAKTVFANDGLVDELKKALAERILNAELDHHLDRDDQQAAGNVRNGTSSKTVLTDSGKLKLSIPRDRHGRFEPALIAKYQRRFPGFDQTIIALYARGMTTRDIQAHLQELYGIEISPELASAVTDAVLDEVAAVPARAARVGPRRRRIRGPRRPRAPQEGDCRDRARGGLAALLLALPAQCPGLPAAQGR